MKKIIIPLLFFASIPTFTAKAYQQLIIDKSGNGECQPPLLRLSGAQAKNADKLLKTLQRYGNDEPKDWQTVQLGPDSYLTGSGEFTENPNGRDLLGQLCQQSTSDIHFDIPKQPPWVFDDPLDDEDEIEWKVVNDQNFILNLSMLGGILGYAWVGGDGSKYVGKDMDVTNLGEHKYQIVGHNSGHCTGYRCKEKTTITLSDFRYTMNPETFSRGEVTETAKHLIKTVETNVHNDTDVTQNATVTLAYQKEDTWSKSEESSISVVVSVSAKFEFPGIGSAESSYTVNAGHSWGSQTGGDTSETVSLQADVTIPAHSTIPVSLGLYKAGIAYPYQFFADASYDATYYGFLRYTGNAWHTHPTDRPFLKHTFNINYFKNKAGSLPYQLEHPLGITLANWWDWPWVAKTSGLKKTELIVSKVLTPIRALVSGHFQAESQFAGDIVIGEAKPNPPSAENSGLSIEQPEDEDVKAFIKAQ